MIDKNKIIQAATKFVQKGQWDKAVKEYQKIIDADPKDIRILQKVGELHQKRGDNAQAAVTFTKVAESYTNDGFFLKAAAVYKQVLKLNPSLVDANLKLAELYQELGLMSNALQQFQLVAAAYEQEGDVQKSLGVLKKIIELDPENAANRIRLAESYSREGMNEEAIAEFAKVAEDLKKSNRTDEYLKVAERLAFLDPQNMKLCRELANVYLEKGDTKRALAKLQTCFKNDPKDIETLTLLAQAFKDLGQTTKTVSVYKELAKLYADADRSDDERKVWRDVLDLAPDDEDAVAWRKAHGGAPTAPAAPAAPAPAPAGRSDADATRIAPRPVAASSPAPSEEEEDEVVVEAVPKLLTEMNVYLKYGLHEKAATHLKKLLAVAPNDLVAHEKGKDLFLAMGEMPRAAKELATCVRLAMESGQRDRAQAHLAKLREIDPKYPELTALGDLVGVDDVVELADDAILDEAPAAEEAPLDEESVPTSAGFDAAVPEEEGADQTSPAMELDAGPGEQETAEPAELDAQPEENFSPAEEPLAEDAYAEAGGQPDLENESTQAYDREALLAQAAGSAPPEAADAGQQEDEPSAPVEEASEPEEPEEFAEAEFFIEQQIWDEAEEALGMLRSRIGEFPHMEERLASLEQRLAAAREEATAAEAPVEEAPAEAAAEEVPLEEAPVDEAPVEAPEPAPEAEGQFDLAAELEKEVEPPPAEEFQRSVVEDLEKFEKGGADVVPAEDVETHYDLGIAYREMGLLDEAISEFELAAQGAAGQPREADCLLQVGTCKDGQGNTQEAASYFERAIEVPGLKPETAAGLYYEIGQARERLGDAGGALEAYEKVAEFDADHRDVADRLARLKGTQRKKIGYL